MHTISFKLSQRKKNAMNRDEFRDTIAQILKLPSSAIDDETNFINDLGIDSLKLLQIVNGIEVHYRVEIDDAQIARINNFDDAYSYVKQLSEFAKT